VQDCLPLRRVIGISRSEGEADGGGGPSTGERLVRIGSEAQPLGDECRCI